MFVGLALFGLTALLCSANRAPRTLHERTCVGLWLPSVHLHGYCIIDSGKRTNCSELDRLFETESSSFDSIPISQVPRLVLNRALQERVLARPNGQLCANIDRTFLEPVTGCPRGFYGYQGSCYVATKRQVSYEQAQHECSQLKGRGNLITDFRKEIINLAKYLTHYYIKADMFTGYHDTENSDDNTLDPIAHNHVEVDYESNELQYVVGHERRGFICVIEAKYVVNVPEGYIRINDQVPLPATVDDVIYYDPHPSHAPGVDLEHHLVDLLEFVCRGNTSRSGVEQHDVIVHRSDLTDLDEDMPFGCYFNRAQGNVIVDPTEEVHDNCPSLKPLYRVSRNGEDEVFVTTEPKTPGYIRRKQRPIGYCATKKGECGANIPFINPGSDVVVCYLFTSHRDLSLEIRERRPLRFIQVANRLTPIYGTNGEVESDYHYQGPGAKQLGSVISSTLHGELDYYCKQHLIPLYRITDLRNKNVFLTSDIEKVRRYRRNRDSYIEEDLLGYCSTIQGYCGASQPLNHYTLRTPGPNLIDDVYYSQEMNNLDAKHDIPCYIF